MDIEAFNLLNFLSSQLLFSLAPRQKLFIDFIKLDT